MIEIRLASYEDVPSLPAIEKAACDLFLQYEFTAVLPLVLTPLKDFYRAQKCDLLWVAVHEEGFPVGFALVEMLDGMAHLEELDVHPGYGRRGIGTGLVKRVCEWAKSGGVTAVRLTTFRDIPWNAPFYRKLWFRDLELKQLPAILRERVEEEEEHGLPRELRVVMQFDTMAS